MVWVEVSEPFAQLPRSSRAVSPLESAAPDGTDHQIFDRALVSGAAFAPPAVISANSSRFEHCDLSRVRIDGLDRTEMVGCKLTGTEVAGAPIEDVVFEDCTFTYTNLRMARLERVRFERCALEEVDAYEARLVDVDFGDSRLVSVDVDKVRGERVDLRRAADLGLRAIGRLDGWLIGEHQLPAMMYALAAGAGLGIERFEEP